MAAIKKRFEMTAEEKALDNKRRRIRKDNAKLKATVQGNPMPASLPAELQVEGLEGLEGLGEMEVEARLEEQRQEVEELLKQKGTEVLSLHQQREQEQQRHLQVQRQQKLRQQQNPPKARQRQQAAEMQVQAAIEDPQALLARRVNKKRSEMTEEEKAIDNKMRRLRAAKKQGASSSDALEAQAAEGEDGFEAQAAEIDDVFEAQAAELERQMEALPPVRVAVPVQIASGPGGRKKRSEMTPEEKAMDNLMRKQRADKKKVAASLGP